jgi:hypothetical protein
MFEALLPFRWTTGFHPLQHRLSRMEHDPPFAIVDSIEIRWHSMSNSQIHSYVLQRTAVRGSSDRATALSQCIRIPFVFFLLPSNIIIQKILELSLMMNIDIALNAFFIHN